MKSSGKSNFLKTKPTQHSVKMLLENGVQPDVLVLRTEHDLNLSIRKKVALFCNVDIDAVVQSIDVSTIYEVPNKMLEEKLDLTVLKKLKLPTKNEPDLKEWNEFLRKHKNPEQEVEIGLVGKYVELQDAYKSIAEALVHAGATNRAKVNLKWIHSEELTPENVEEQLEGLDGVIIAPGFGHRGIEGKIKATQYVRENNIPFLGICLGMQIAVIEYARNVLGMTGADSTEMNDKTTAPVIALMEDQKGISEKGGTMRLGAYDCHIVNKKSNFYKTYGKTDIRERHRHRYEFNNHYLEAFKQSEMKPVGINPDTDLVEAMEIMSHKWFIGVQFHPEYSSTVLNPHPLFVAFIKATLSTK
jgi:CTP synthase